MPYIARRRMVGGGKQYEGGDVVPAENWPTRRALVSCRRIEFVAVLPEKTEVVIETPEEKMDTGHPPPDTPENKTNLESRLLLLRRENEKKMADPQEAAATISPKSTPEKKTIPLISMRVGDIRKRIAKIKDLKYLNQLLEQETKGKNRASATAAIEKRIKAVRN